MNEQDKAAFSAAYTKWKSSDEEINPSLYFWQAALAHRDSQQNVVLSDEEIEAAINELYKDPMATKLAMLCSLDEYKAVMGAMEAKNRGQGCESILFRS